MRKLLTLLIVMVALANVAAARPVDDASGDAGRADAAASRDDHPILEEVRPGDGARANIGGEVITLPLGLSRLEHTGEPLPLPALLTNVYASVVAVWQFESQAGAWRVFAPALPSDTQTLSMLEPGPFYVLTREAARWLPPPSFVTGEWVVSWRRSGGFAGIDETLIVTAGGAARAVSGEGSARTFAVAPSALDALGSLLLLHAFLADEALPPPGACLDCFRDELTIYPPAGRPIVIDTEQPNLSPALAELLGVLEAVALS